MIQRLFNLHLHAGHKVPLVINANQYDSGEQWLFTLYNGAVQYTPSSGAIVGIKSDRLGIINSGTVDSAGRVVINETKQMTAAVGKNVFELLIDDQTHGTANFIVLVEPKPGDNADFSASDLSLLQQAIDGTSETAIKNGVQEWMDDNLAPSEWVIDSSLSTSGAAADAKKTGDELSALKSAIDAKSSLTDAVKSALLQIVQKVAYIDDSGQDYYGDLYDALYPPADLVSISAVYTQSGEVLSTDSLDSLKSDLVVTGLYDDASTRVISNYTLSGNLTSPTATITASYGGFTTTFSVTVTYVDNSLYNWDFTKSLTDSKQGVTATLPSTAAQSSIGVKFTNSTDNFQLITASLQTMGQFTIEVDVASFATGGSGNYTSLWLARSTSQSTGVVYRVGNTCWSLRDTEGTYFNLTDYTDKTMFNGKTMKLQVDYDISKCWKLYVDNELIASKAVSTPSTTSVRIGLMGYNAVYTGFRVYEGLV